MPMVLVLLLVAVDIYTFDFVWAPYKFSSSPGLTVLACLWWNSCVFLLVASYLRCIFTSNSQKELTPPSNWDNRFEQNCFSSDLPQS